MSSCLQHNHAHSHEHDYQHNENFQNIADDHPHQSHPFRKRYTFRDVYNAAATERSFDYVFWMHVSLDIIGDNLIIIASKLLVVIAIFLILGLGYSGFLVIVPLISEQTPHMYYIHMVIGGFIYFNIIFNYFFAVTTNAGTPSDYIHLSPVNQTFNGSLSVTVASPTGQDVALHNYSECKKCRYPKPLRAHHCSLCNSCIMRMDHHCPWLANCVGLRNYRFFFSFLLWVTLGTAYLGLACVPSILSPGSLLFPAGGPDILPLFYPQRLIDAFRSTDHTNSPSSKQSRLGSLRGRHHKVAHLGGNPDDGSLSSVYHQINQTLKYKANNNSKNRINSTKNTKHPMKESDVNAVAENRRLIALNTLVAIQSDLNGPKLDDQSRKLEDNHHLHIVEPHSGRKVEWYETLLQILKGKEVLIFVTFIGSTAVSIGVGVLFGFHFYLVMNGCTTIEMFSFEHEKNEDCKDNKKKRWKSPFSKGAYKNFCELFGTNKWYIAILPRINVPLYVEELYLGADFSSHCVIEDCDDKISSDSSVSIARTSSFKVGSFGSVTNRYNVNVYHPFAQTNSTGGNIHDD